MERISSKHGPRLDDALAEEAAPLVHGAAHEPRAQEHRESEETAGLPPGGAVARREIARHLDSRIFPAGRDAIVGNAAENGAPDSVLGLLSALPGGVTYRNQHDLWEGVSRFLGSDEDPGLAFEREEESRRAHR